MCKGKLASALIFAVLLGVPGTLLAEEPVIPPVSPRSADTLVMLPDGSTVRVELAKTEAEQNYGLMGRSSLPEGRGMLFVHDRSGEYRYWMYHCLIALDIVWMDEAHRVVEISAKTPPCRGQANSCPNYGGNAQARYVLELPAGAAGKHGVAVGQTIRFGL